MKTLISVLTLTAVTLGGCAMKAENTYLKVGSYVKHHSNGNKYTERFGNRLIHVENEVNKKDFRHFQVVNSVGAGTNINSYGKRSYNITGSSKVCRKDIVNNRFCGGVMVGAATGYGQQTGSKVTPIGGVVATIDHKSGVGIAALIVPSYKNIDGIKSISTNFNVFKVINTIKRYLMVVNPNNSI